MSRQAQVQRVAKIQPFTVTLIGGKEDLAMWKANKEILDKIDGTKRKAASREAAIDAYMNNGWSFSELDEEIRIAFTRMFIDPQHKKYSRNPSLPELILNKSRPPSIKQRLERFLGRLWRSAFPLE